MLHCSRTKAKLLPITVRCETEIERGVKIRGDGSWVKETEESHCPSKAQNHGSKLIERKDFQFPLPMRVPFGSIR